MLNFNYEPCLKLEHQQGERYAQQWHNLLMIYKDKVGWQQKLKHSIPIVPYILDFEGENDADLMRALEEAWEQLVSKISR